MTAAAEVQVSVAEVCEVRGQALEAQELLALAVSAADVLPQCPKGTVFDAETVYITGRGQVVIETIAASKAEAIFSPPEWVRGENEPSAAAVYCMGAVMRACGAEEANDVDLFSLVNILTVAMVGTRPTAHRMGQMARNQLKGRDAQTILLRLYEEVMGDEESNQLPDDMDYDDLDELDDDFEMAPVRPPPTRTVSNVSQSKVAAPVYSDSDEESDDHKETRGASLSTSSGNSTQKDPSPFEDEIITTEPQRVPSPVPPPRSPRRSFDSIGSPLANSTRLDRSFIEEKSLDISFGSNQEEEAKEVEEVRPEIVTTTSTTVIVTPTTTTVFPTPTSSSQESSSLHSSIVTVISSHPEPMTSTATANKRPITNPFNDSFEEIDHGGTLSGRDPFESTSHQSSPPTKKFIPPTTHFESTPPSKQHRFSSSEDEIVEVDIDEEEDFRSARGKDYFSEIVQREEDPKPYFKQMPVPTIMKHAAVVQADSSASEISTTASSARGRGSSMADSTAEIDQLREESKKLAQRLEKDISSSDEEEDDRRRRPMPTEPTVLITTPKVVPPKQKTAQIIESDDEEEETSIDDAFHEYRRNSHSPPVIPPPVIEPIVSPIEDTPPPKMERHNSLVPARISRRSSTRTSRGKRKTRAIPEFFDTARHPSIRLKAPSSRKKNFTILRVEQTEVWVELLNGQRVEVACRTDVAARDVFSLVVQHMNLNEHIFFGLAYQRDGENFFLEDHQRLEKFAPPGWKSGSRSAQRHQFVLYLRFRFYPQILDFVKTPVTLHELYLQVRRDVIDERIQPKRDAAFDLAALALQAEFGNRPPPAIVDYFDNEHYLAKRFCMNDDPKRLKVLLGDLHSTKSKMSTIQAEHEYIQICQRHPEFGAHLHRVFRNKPLAPVGSAPFDPDTGAALWIAIMPKGIAVYEEEGGLRQRLSDHLWKDTQTLQFDKKKFVIIAVKDGYPSETIFYTDHHTKSSYFVKFSASQHRFMMKMRSWKSTLRHENSIQAHPDVAIEGTPEPMPVRVILDHRLEEAENWDGPSITYMHAISPDPIASPLDAAPSMFEKMPAKRPSQAPPVKPSSPEPQRVLENFTRDSTFDRSIYDESVVSNSHLERFETAATSSSNSTPMRCEVTLIKDPSAGLGLTLVDGNLNGIKGVYVKSVAENGAGMRAGLCVGDRLLSIDGRSLEGGDRHRAVELVKACGSQVRMEIGRVDGVVRHEKSLSRDGDVSKQSNGLNSTPKGVSRTPPPPRRAANKRVRAVSDFGAIGDTLPALDDENIINIRAISGLHLDESDEEKGEYRLPTTSIYSFDKYEDEEPSSPVKKPTGSPLVSRQVGAEAKKRHRYARKSSNPEFELENVGEEDHDPDTIKVALERNDVGSLGVQIATIRGHICIKQLTAPPAFGHPNIRVGMLLVSVNGEDVTGKQHKDVVQMLRQGGERVVLGLKAPQEEESFEESQQEEQERADEKNGKTLTVTVNKQAHGSLGLSLARRTGSDGNFIRMIAEGSAAADEGNLRVGDRIVSVDGVPVDGLTPGAIHDRLKTREPGLIKITVSRNES